MPMDQSLLIPPCGGRLVDLLVPSEQRDELLDRANRLPSFQISERSVCDLELLACGAFSPLERFVGKEAHQRILEEMRLPDGHIFPIPISLPVLKDDELHLDREVALRNFRNEVLAILTVEEIYEWDFDEVSLKVFGTNDPRHPLIAEMDRWGRLNVSGSLRVIQLPQYHDFLDLRLTPVQTRDRLKQLKRGNVVAFQTRNPLHRAHEELTKRAIAGVDGTLLLHPVVGLTKPGDVDYYARVRTYKVLADRYYDQTRTVLALLPLAMRLAGPREALWHALIRRNYGANHLIVGRDHASPGLDSENRPFYSPYAAQELVELFSAELGISVIRFQEMLYNPRTKSYEESSGEDASLSALSGTEAREQYLNKGRRLPEWFTRAEVSQILEEAYPPRDRQGVCIWFTGLSGAGKSTTAEVLTAKLLELGRRVTLLDGDVVRTHLSKGLGFSKEDRDTNVRRIGFVASEIVRHGGIALCSLVSPYRATRNDVRNMFAPDQFIEVFVNTPLAVCEQRDPKGIYARMRRGEISGVTGIDDPYEPPENPEIVIETVSRAASENALLILDNLADHGFVASAGRSAGQSME
jgi:sulfate adenylyltransferase